MYAYTQLIIPNAGIYVYSIYSNYNIVAMERTDVKLTVILLLLVVVLTAVQTDVFLDATGYVC